MPLPPMKRVLLKLSGEVLMGNQQFGIDPAFSDAIDGLIEVDIAAMRPKKRERYLGEAWRPTETVA